MTASGRLKKQNKQNQKSHQKKNKRILTVMKPFLKRLHKDGKGCTSKNWLHSQKNNPLVSAIREPVSITHHRVPGETKQWPTCLIHQPEEDLSADGFMAKYFHFFRCCPPHFKGYNGPSNNQEIILRYFLPCSVLSFSKDHQNLSLHSLQS